jgi:phosphosulfolactate synthase
MLFNYHIPFLPQRESRPRKKGLTMVMDKGLSVAEAEHMIASSGHLIDFVKLGFGTSLITAGLTEKIRFYQKAGVKVYFGGTLFEAFLVRNAIEEYIAVCRKAGVDHVEISDGSLSIPHELKLDMIGDFSKHFTVLSEVGSKQADVVLSDDEWVRQINLEMEAGSSFVIAEAREGGNVGIYDNTGQPKTDLIELIRSKTEEDRIMWEAPNKPQQVWFIKQFGTNVNLGNIATNEVIALETLRLGLRGDTFFDFLPEELKDFH